MNGEQMTAEDNAPPATSRLQTGFLLKVLLLHAVLYFFSLFISARLL
jgi:hypothetical protein